MGTYSVKKPSILLLSQLSMIPYNIIIENTSVNIIMEAKTYTCSGIGKSMIYQ